MRISKIGLAASVALIGLAGGPKADAAYIAYMYQDGANVTVTGSGSIDTTDLSEGKTGVVDFVEMDPAFGALAFGDPSANSDEYLNVSGPTSFGTSASEEFASTSSGAVFALFANTGVIGVPSGYVSGTAIGTGTATWDSTTLAALGVTDGTYTWTWGTSLDADSITLDIGEAPPSAAPEPMSLVLLGTGLVGLALKRGRRAR